jgi:K+-transporting ATPase ATPase C chain
MTSHLRASLWLLLFSVVLCSVVYPLVLLNFAQAFFSNRAQGSLLDARGKPVTDPGKAVGSRLIAQAFSGDQYFQPRPSQVNYNAAASGASNWAANNYLLRDRVARDLGPIVKYKGTPPRGKTVQQDLTDWFQKKFEVVAQWAEAHPTLAQNWVKADKLNADYVEAWANAHKAEVDEWMRENPATPRPKPEDLAVIFFKSFSSTFPGSFPDLVGEKGEGGEKRIVPVRDGTTIERTFFDTWRQEHPDVELEPVPADMVMASASGLDPHITLKNARYQLDRVSSEWAKLTKREVADVRKKIEEILNNDELVFAPLGGLAGVKMVNVLELNLELRHYFGAPSAVAPKTERPGTVETPAGK